MVQLRLDQLNLVVRDVQASRTFYARLGVEFEGESDPVWAVHHVSGVHTDRVPLNLDLDSTSFATKWNRGWPGRPGVVIGFKVDRRDEVDELAADGVTVQQQPLDAFWGARYAVVSDPDGNGVGIMSPVDPARRTEPPAPG
jgi:catechol 2,3-dioxygenase-like lactoylglutathione lyase family enzyme